MASFAWGLVLTVHAHANPAPTPIIIEAALKYLGAKCDSLTAVGCNPYQLPVYDEQIDGYFVPQLLLKVSAEDVDPDPNEQRDYSSHEIVSMHSSDQSTSDASSFGISASVPYDGIVFSGGVQHQQLTKSMYSSSSAHFYSEVHRSYIVYSASLAKEVAGDGLQQAIDDLPYSVESEEDRQKWLVFFSEYGTHYIKSVSFGGTMRLTTFVDVAVKEDSQFTQSDWSFNLGATFAKFAGLDISFDNDHTKEKYDRFFDYQKDQHFFAIGGDQSITDFDSWLGTVKANPAPVFTTLGSIADLLSSKDSTTALKAYFDACPHTDENGVCNGYGRCDPLGRTCSCSDSSTYLDDDGNCYLKCPNDCNQNGLCVAGKCQCFTYSGFGYSGDACHDPCGTQTYDAGSGYCQADGDLCLDPKSDGATCWCRKNKIPAFSDHDEYMMASHTESGGHPDNTQYCGGGVCHNDHFLQPNYCGTLRVITCKFGEGKECPKSSIEIPTRRSPPTTMRIEASQFSVPVTV